MIPLTIVMYHYVRDVDRAAYPNFRALAVDDFRGQLDYLERHYTILTLEEVLMALDGRADRLPSNGALLTFDDGHKDHFDTVYPELRKRGLQGLFFPPARPVLESRVLSVNKIQHVLSVVESPRPLFDDLVAAIADADPQLGLRPVDHYLEEYCVASRFDPAEVIFFKRMLQHVLPVAFRERHVDAAFEKYVTPDEAMFARSLYMSTDELREMIDNGMYVGSHGYNHDWLDQLSGDDMRTEIERSLEFLESLGAKTDPWVMCYPYGGYDDGVLGAVAKMGCSLGMTTRPGIADIGVDDRLALPRLDTNDFPHAADAPINEHTRMVARPH